MPLFVHDIDNQPMNFISCLIYGQPMYFYVLNVFDHPDDKENDVHY